MAHGDVDDALPERIGRYRILGRLGQGGMGLVFRAHDPELDRVVAVKVLRPDRAGGGDGEEARARLLREARALARLAHPHVIHVYDVGTLDDGEVFVTMELVDGQTLTTWLGVAPRPPEVVVGVFLEAARGLVAAHEAGLVHRDFKPDNVMVGEDGRVRVLDFGLARGPRATAGVSDTWVLGGDDAGSAPSDFETQAGAVMGTPLYMAPEQLRGEEATEASDQYSFFAALYEALFGQPPCGPAPTQVYLARVLRGEVVAPSATSVAARFWPVVRTGLALAPPDRHPSLEEGLALLELELEGGLAFLRTPDASAAAPVPGPATPAGPNASRSWPLVLGLVLLALGAAWWAMAPSPGEPTAPAVAPASPPPSAREAAAVGAVERVPVAPPAVEDARSKTVPDPRPADVCYLHEDQLTLLQRGRYVGVHLRDADGRCLACRVETRATRIARFRPDDCDRYFLCGPAAELTCG